MKERKIELKIVGLSSGPATGGTYALILKDIESSRRLPIVIGASEAHAIAIELEGYKTPRPLTHDLLKSTIETLGGTVVEVFINDLKDNTFYASIYIEQSGLTLEIDSRPSDAIALAVRLDIPIFTNEEIMELASFIPPNNEKSNPQSEYSSLNNQENDYFNEINEFDEHEEPSEPINEPNSIASLQNQLREALEKEDYERAAILRDKINRLSDLS